ncbi:hypothetical protein AMECASPLE_007185 [Ameca splendens]|uniref:Uncharacterized protein n=1 Tax=Ameca splendens TaxID=208324 RepID=A0ABV0ZL72_9TELE
MPKRNVKAAEESCGGVHMLWHMYPSSTSYINTFALSIEMADCGDESSSNHWLLHHKVVTYQEGERRRGKSFHASMDNSGERSVSSSGLLGEKERYDGPSTVDWNKNKDGDSVSLTPPNFFHEFSSRWPTGENE